MKDIPVVNRFQGVVSFFVVGVFQGTLTSDREGKLKEIPSFFFFSFCIPLVISPTSSSLVSTSRVLPGKKRKVSLLSSASHLFDIQTPRSGSEQSVTGRTGLSPFHPCLYLHVSHSLFHYLFGGSSLVCTVNQTHADGHMGIHSAGGEGGEGGLGFLKGVRVVGTTYLLRVEVEVKLRGKGERKGVNE